MKIKGGKLKSERATVRHALGESLLGLHAIDSADKAGGGILLLLAAVAVATAVLLLRLLLQFGDIVAVW